MGDLPVRGGRIEWMRGDVQDLLPVDADGFQNRGRGRGGGAREVSMLVKRRGSQAKKKEGTHDGYKRSLQ